MKETEIKLVALRALRYDAQSYKAGDVFTAPSAHALALIAVKTAKKFEEAPLAIEQPGKRMGRPLKGAVVYKTRDMTPES